MTTRQLYLGEAYGPAKTDGFGEARSPERRRKVAGFLLFAALLGALVVAGWGVLSSLGNRDEVPARLGEPVALPGGALVVDGVTPESMAPMQTSKFSASGMNMPAMGMDMAPEGYRRFTVEVTLAAGEAASLAYSAEDFRVSGNGTKTVAPLRDQLEGASLPAGSEISGTLVFQVPDEAKNLTLSYRGGQPVALDLGPKSGGHSQGDHH